MADPAVLVTLSQPEMAGEVIDCCDSILLKPFAPNLLSSRVARLLRLGQRVREARERSVELARWALRERAKANHLCERVRTSTLVEWPNEQCPHCGHRGIVEVDRAGFQRAWYACASCRNVWLARCRE